jgi:WD40 repeat protein
MDATTGRELYTIKLEDPDRPGTQQHGFCLQLSDDGKTLIAISSYSPKQGGAFIPEILLTGWDMASRKQLFRRSRAPEDFGMAISPDGKMLAVSQGSGIKLGPKKPAGQGPIRLEDVATGEHLLTLPVLERQTQPLAFSPDSRLLTTNTLGPAPPGVVGGPDENAQTLRLWEVATGAELLALRTVTNAYVAFSRDGHIMALSVPSQEVLLWDLRRNKELRRIRKIGAEVTSLAFSPDGDRLVSGLSDSSLLVWDVKADRETRRPGRLDAQGAAQAWVDLAPHAAP